MGAPLEQIRAKAETLKQRLADPSIRATPEQRQEAEALLAQWEEQLHPEAPMSTMPGAEEPATIAYPEA
ncbi:MAG: hypothetical protein D6731_15715, partial [Planctomycetota bacterium]